MPTQKLHCLNFLLLQLPRTKTLARLCPLGSYWMPYPALLVCHWFPPCLLCCLALLPSPVLKQRPSVWTWVKGLGRLLKHTHRSSLRADFTPQYRLKCSHCNCFLTWKHFYVQLTLICSWIKCGSLLKPRVLFSHCIAGCSLLLFSLTSSGLG